MAVVVDLINKGGLALVIAVLVIGGYKRWYLWAWSVDAIIKEKDAQITLLTRDRDGWKTSAERGVSEAKIMIEWAAKMVREEKE